MSHAIGPSDLLHPSPAPHFKTFQVFLIYFPKRLKIQHRTKLCSKCTKLLVSSLNWSSVCLWNVLLVNECCFRHGNPRFVFPCTPCIFCCHNSWNNNYSRGSVAKQITLVSGLTSYSSLSCIQTTTAGQWVDLLHIFPELRSIPSLILYEELLFHKTTWQRSTATGAKWFVYEGPKELEGTTDGDLEGPSNFFPTIKVTSFRALIISKKKNKKINASPWM
jgi:hypothetical protein